MTEPLKSRQANTLRASDLPTNLPLVLAQQPVPIKSTQQSKVPENALKDMTKNPASFGLSTKDALDYWVIYRLCDAGKKNPANLYQINYVLEAMDSNPDLVNQLKALRAKKPNADFNQEPLIRDLVKNAPHPGIQIFDKFANAAATLGLLASGAELLQGIKIAMAKAGGNQLVYQALHNAVFDGIKACFRNPKALIAAARQAAIGGAREFWIKSVVEPFSAFKTIVWRAPGEYGRALSKVLPSLQKVGEETYGFFTTPGNISIERATTNIAKGTWSALNSKRADIIKYQVPNLVRNFLPPKMTGNKIVDGKTRLDREKALAIAYSSILVGTTGISVATQPPGVVVNGLSGNLSGFTSAMFFTDRKPSSVGALMLTSGISSKYAGLLLLDYGGKASKAGLAWRAGVQLDLRIAGDPRTQSIANFTLGDLGQYMLSRSATTIASNSVGQQVVNLQKKGHMDALNASQILAALALSNVRNTAYFKSVTLEPGKNGYYGKLMVYVATTALGIMASITAKSLYPTTPSKNLTDAQRKRVMQQTKESLGPNFDKVVNGAVDQIKTMQSLQKLSLRDRNFGNSSFASLNDTSQAILGSSPWDIGYAAIKRDDDGFVVLEKETVEVLNHGNSIVNVVEPVYELGVKYGFLKVKKNTAEYGQRVLDVERIRNNTQAAQVVNAVLDAAKRKSPIEYDNTLARLMNPYGINHGSNHMRRAYERYQEDLLFRSAIDLARKRLGIKPLPKLLEPIPADANFVKGVFNGKPSILNTTSPGSSLNPPIRRF